MLWVVFWISCEYCWKQPRGGCPSSLRMLKHILVGKHLHIHLWNKLNRRSLYKEADWTLQRCSLWSPVPPIYSSGRGQQNLFAFYLPILKTQISAFQKENRDFRECSHFIKTAGAQHLPGSVKYFSCTEGWVFKAWIYSITFRFTRDVILFQGY